jgi:predicted nucleotidyltransferase
MTQVLDLEPILERAVKALVEAVDPEQIILFGSAARGEFGEDSDLDFLVVIPQERERRDASRRAWEALQDLELPKDVFITTHERLSRYGDVRWTLEESALREGRRLYARS